MVERESTFHERGGVPLRDYTQGGRPASLRGGSGLSGRTAGMSFNTVARGLGVFSLGLGLMQLLMPERVQRMVGVRCGDYSGLIRAMGGREIAHGLLSFINPQVGAWSRVAGDALDLGALGAGLTTPGVQKNRTLTAMATVLGLSALDFMTAQRMNRRKSQRREAAKRVSTVTQKDLDHRTRSGAFSVTRSITVNHAPETLYQYWHNFENLPNFMYHLETVRVLDNQRSYWVAKAPAGASVEWTAEMTEDRPNELIAWRSLPDSTVPNSGRVTFEPAPRGHGTVVRVEIEYNPPAGVIGKAIATLFGQEPGQQVAGDLNRFKQVMETGEVVRSEGSPQGQGQFKQHPAQPMGEKKKRGEKQTDKYGQRSSRRETEQSRIRDIGS